MRYIITESQRNNSLSEIFNIIWKDQISSGEDPSIDDIHLKMFNIKRFGPKYKELLVLLREFLGDTVAYKLLMDYSKKQFDTSDYPNISMGTYDFIFEIDIVDIDMENSDVYVKLSYVDGVVNIGNGDENIEDVLNHSDAYWEVRLEIKDIVDEILNSEIGNKIGYYFIVE